MTHTQIIPDNDIVQLLEQRIDLDAALEAADDVDDLLRLTELRYQNDATVHNWLVFAAAVTHA